MRRFFLVFGLALGLVSVLASDQDDFEDFGELEQSLQFDDTPQIRDTSYPDWFKVSFLDLPEDLKEANVTGKRGIMVYFGQKHCAYCEALIEVNFGKEDIVAYTRQHFDFISIDIWGDRDVVTLDEEVMSEKQFAERERTQFTPYIIFYDADGDEVMRLRGYYPPYKFRAALEYVADSHYDRETFREYLERAEPGLAFEQDELIEEDFFEPSPHILDRSRFRASQPLAVLFEQGDCHACEVLHSEQFQDPIILDRLEHFEVVQLDMWSDTPVVTPAGERTTARQWAHDLGLFYAPTLLFFDEHGREIIRLDSVFRFHRLNSVLRYVLSNDYEDQPYFQRWRENLLDGPQADTSK